MEHKLCIEIKPSKHIKYNPEQLFETILYFCWQKLKHFNHEDLPEIYIEIGTKDAEKLDHCGMFDALDVLNGGLAYIVLSTKQLKSDKYRYKDGIKSLLHMLLHEFYHMHTCISTYIKSDKSISLHEWQHQRYINYQQECEDMVEAGIDEDLAYSYSVEEMAAEAYAFENLAYIENLYNYGFLVTPPDGI